MGKSSSNSQDSRPAGSSPQPPDEQKPEISGKPANLKVMLALAKVDEEDIESALLWFDEHASDQWKGALG